MQLVPMTPQGFEELKKELSWRQKTERPRIIQAISEARAHGDLSENAEYHAAKEAQSLNEGRINLLEDTIAHADIIDISKLSGDTIKFGATVTLLDEETEQNITYQIVGAHETDAKNGKISISSPMSRALIGKSVGDTIEVILPNGKKDYEILGIRYI